MTTEVCIITIGDELLIGQVIDTNSAWIAQQLNLIGMAVRKRVAVGDQWDDIWNVLNEESKSNNIIIITGGLGPTADDITKPLLCKYFNGKMIVNEKVLQHVKNIFEVLLKRPMIERNAKQAEVPDTCTVLHNSRGTAPGMLFEKDGCYYFSLPGVPHEMKGLMTDHVIPIIQQKFPAATILHRTMVTTGLGESFLADHIKEVEASLPAHIKLAYLPNYGLVRLRLSARGNDKQALEKELEHHFSLLKQKVGKYLVTDKDEPMETVVAHLLRQSKKTVGTAESCTGGYIAQLFTQHAGSSDYFEGSIISYSNHLKEELLGVDKTLLDTYGAVSEQTVTAMVKGALNHLKTDYVIAVSGIMGPDGGTPEKPVGWVWVAVGDKNKVRTQSFQMRFDRRRNIDMTAVQALNLLRMFIEENNTVSP